MNHSAPSGPTHPPVHPIWLDIWRSTPAHHPSISLCPGFFQCRGHGISAATIARFDAASRAFFALPRGQKAAVKRSASNSRGWFDDELTKQTVDWKEGMDIGQPGASEIDGVNQWPADSACPGFRPHITDYYEVHKSCTGHDGGMGASGRARGEVGGLPGRL